VTVLEREDEDKEDDEGGKEAREIVVKHIARKIMISLKPFRLVFWLVVLRRRRRRNISARHDGHDAMGHRATTVRSPLEN
jgi:hypothetical protein